jgi:DNA gyrase/topoisomerase IV subunit A
MLEEKEEELKKVRKSLEETQEKLHEQTLLATRLKTTLDNVKESFDKERKLIQMEAEKKAQEAYQAQQQEIFQKQLELMDKWQQQGGGPGGGNMAVPPAAMFETVQQQQQQQQQPPPISDEPPAPDIVAPSPVPEAMKKSTTVAATAGTTAKSTKHPWSKKDKKSNEPNLNRALEDSNGTLINSAVIDYDVNDSDGEEGMPPSAPPPTPSERQEQPTDIKSTDSRDTNGFSASKNSSNKQEAQTTMKAAAQPSDRFTPVYVAPSQPVKVAAAAVQEEPVDDDGITIGQTVASSTYGEDRIKVVQKELLDPYGDKGVYTGVVLRTTGMPHGLGRMIYEEDGRIFEGDW